MVRAPKLPRIDTEERFLAQDALAYGVEGLTQEKVVAKLGVTRLCVDKALPAGQAPRRPIWSPKNSRRLNTTISTAYRCRARGHPPKDRPAVPARASDAQMDRRRPPPSGRSRPCGATP